MHSTFAVMAGLASVALASPMPQGVTEIIPPTSAAPAGCQTSYDGKFEITAVTPSLTKRTGLEKRACGAAGSLTISLQNGVLKDALDRSGYIADNYQFQFDGPPQAGAIYTGGFSVCQNGSLALGGSAVFYQCLSGEFYNLYDRSWAPQCAPILIDVLPCSGSSSSGSTAAAPVASQIVDGQPQAPSAIPVSELPDGQPQVPTGIPVTQIGDGQVQAPTATATAITQIGDGQVQAPSATAITQIGDGQVQAPSATPITQIGDGQIQAPSATPITQIGDGQIQAPTAATNGSAVTTSPPLAQVTSGAATLMGSSLALLLAGVAAVLLL